MTAGGDDESARRLAEIRRAVERAPEVQPEPPESEIYAPEPAGGEGRRSVHLRVIGGDAATAGARSPRPEESEAGFVLDVTAPFDAVQRLVERDRTVGGMTTLRYWRGTWVCWDGRSSYEILSEQALRQWLYKSLATSYQGGKGVVSQFEIAAAVARTRRCQANRRTGLDMGIELDRGRAIMHGMANPPPYRRGRRNGICRRDLKASGGQPTHTPARSWSPRSPRARSRTRPAQRPVGGEAGWPGRRRGRRN